MNTQIRTLGGGLGLAVLAAGMFAWGIRAAPTRPAGRDLLRMASATGRTPVVSLTALNTRVAQGVPEGRATPDGNTDDSDEPGAIFQDVYTLVKQKYVDAMPTDTQFAHAAASSMLASLQDPDTRFLEPAEMAELADEAHGVYHGLGAATAVRQVPHAKQGEVPAYTELRLTIVAPLPGGPADKAGLRPGDVITSVNGQEIAALLDSTGQFDPAVTRLKDLKALESDPVSYNKLVASLEAETKTAMPMTQAQSLLTDRTRKTLTLTVRRPGLAQPMTVNVDPGTETTAPSVTAAMLPGGIADIRIAQFTDATDAQFAAALASLDPATMKGLVLDLRDCPGGLLDVGQSVAARLTAAPALGILVSKGHRQTPIALTPNRAVNCPIVVLVNGGTANTAELLAATLQQSGDRVIGTDTFGDAADVRPVALHDGSGFTMTVGTLLTAQHQAFAGRGIKPDVLVPDAPGADLPLARAVGALTGRTAQG